jgi:hypothetical protein
MMIIQEKNKYNDNAYRRMMIIMITSCYDTTRSFFSFCRDIVVDDDNNDNNNDDDDDCRCGCGDQLTFRVQQQQQQQLHRRRRQHRQQQQQQQRRSISSPMCMRFMTVFAMMIMMTMIRTTSGQYNPILHFVNEEPTSASLVQIKSKNWIPYGFIFLHPNSTANTHHVFNVDDETDICVEEFQMIKDLLYTTYTGELLVTTPLTTSELVSIDPMLDDSTIFQSFLNLVNGYTNQNIIVVQQPPELQLSSPTVAPTTRFDDEPSQSPVVIGQRLLQTGGEVSSSPSSLPTLSRSLLPTSEPTYWIDDSEVTDVTLYDADVEVTVLDTLPTDLDLFSSDYSNRTLIIEVLMSHTTAPSQSPSSFPTMIPTVSPSYLPIQSPPHVVMMLPPQPTPTGDITVYDDPQPSGSQTNNNDNNIRRRHLVISKQQQQQLNQNDNWKTTETIMHENSNNQDHQNNNINEEEYVMIEEEWDDNDDHLDEMERDDVLLLSQEQRHLQRVCRRYICFQSRYIIDVLGCRRFCSRSRRRRSLLQDQDQQHDQNQQHDQDHNQQEQPVDTMLNQQQQQQQRSLQRRRRKVYRKGKHDAILRGRGEVAAALFYQYVKQYISDEHPCQSVLLSMTYIITDLDIR